MKLPIAGLFLLGILAAVAAAVLVASIRAPSKPGDPEAEASSEVAATHVRILVAARDLESLTVLSAEDLTLRDVEKDVAPLEALTDPIQVVGKLLTVPLVAEQPFLTTQFASESSRLHMVAALESGKRAVNVILSDPMGMEELLYPGSVVDVLTSVKVKEQGSTQDETLSVTLLQGVTVLAVGSRSVVNPRDEEEDEDFVLRRGRRPAVTLLVDPDEAELVKLAMHSGSVSLTLRNPMDDSRTTNEGTRITEVSPILKAREELAMQEALAEKLEREREAQRKELLVSYELQRAAYDDEREQAKIEIDRDKFELERLKASKELAEELKPSWETVVIRGGVSETKTFDQTTQPSDL